MMLVFSEDEKFPLIPYIFKSEKDNKLTKQAQDNFKDHLTKPMYYRNIIEKKELLKQGLISQ
jgi:hypothetical protein